MQHVLQSTTTETGSAISMPRLFLHLEGLVMLVVTVIIYGHVSGNWLAFIALLLVPDLTILAYRVNVKVGSAVYNVAHFYGLPLGLALAAFFAGWTTVLAIALIWLAHISMDRAVGYGLKYATEFKDTHMSHV
jgi:hypothetical protein